MRFGNLNWYELSKADEQEIARIISDPIFLSKTAVNNVLDDNRKEFEALKRVYYESDFSDSMDAVSETVVKLFLEAIEKEEQRLLTNAREELRAIHLIRKF